MLLPLLLALLLLPLVVQPLSLLLAVLLLRLQGRFMLEKGVSESKGRGSQSQ